MVSRHVEKSRICSLKSWTFVAESSMLPSTIQSAPMNMEEWQRKLKMEKEASRQKKTESAEILRGYRGELKDDDMKLKAIREEERKKHQDAQELLHNYKGLQFQEGMAKSKERPEQHFPTPVNAGSNNRDDVLDSIVLGSVSERAAALAAAAAKAPIPIPDSAAVFRNHPVERSNPDKSGSSNGVVDALNHGLDGNEKDDDDDDDDFGPSLPTNSIQTPMNIVSDAPTVTNDPLLGTTSNMDSVSAADAVRSDESVLAENVPTTMNFAPATTSEVSPSVSKPFRVDVLFAFGLVTIQVQPNLDSYLSAVQSIVAASLEQTTSTVNPLYPPYVKNTEWDCKFVAFISSMY